MALQDLPCPLCLISRNTACIFSRTRKHMARFVPASLPFCELSAERGQAFLASRTPEDPTERAR